MQRSFSNSPYQSQIEKMDHLFHLIDNSLKRKEYDLALKQADDAEKMIDEIVEVKNDKLKYTYINLQRGIARALRAQMNMLIGNQYFSENGELVRISTDFSIDKTISWICGDDRLVDPSRPRPKESYLSYRVPVRPQDVPHFPRRLKDQFGNQALAAQDIAVALKLTEKCVLDYESAYGYEHEHSKHSNNQLL